MKKIVLINPPLSSREQGSLLYAAVGRSVPYGLLSIGSILRRAGYAVSFIDAANAGYGMVETADRAMRFNPGYVGISAVTVSIKSAAALAEELKRRDGNLTVILGGMHVSALPEQTLREFGGFDIGVVGEGEETVVELLHVLDAGGAPGDVKGIVYRSQGLISRTAPRPFISDLDSLPLPGWDLLADTRTFSRLSATSHIRLPAAPLVTSRGCPAHCIFCSCKAMFGELRSFSAGYVIRMIQQLITAYGIKDISIYDDNFLYAKDRVREFCAGIRREKLRFAWSCYSRIDHGDPELFKLMKNSGCWQVSYGIESGSQRMLDFLGKGITLEQIKNTVDQTKKAGLRARGFFMIGLPSEDAGSMRETVRLLLKLKLDDFHIAYYNPFPGTGMAGMSLRYGRVERAWEKMNMHYPSFIPFGLSRAELERCSKTAYKRFYFRPRIIWGYLLIVARYPENIIRLVKGVRAVLCKVFLREDG